MIATVALHIGGVIILFQYAFSRRQPCDSCPPYGDSCPNHSPSFHRPYTPRDGQWWRRSFIDSRSQITATPVQNTPTKPLEPKLSKEQIDASQVAPQSQRERLSRSTSKRRAEMKPTNPMLIENIPLPNLSIRVRRDSSSEGETGSEWSTTEGSSTESMSSYKPYAPPAKLSRNKSYGNNRSMRSIRRQFRARSIYRRSGSFISPSGPVKTHLPLIYRSPEGKFIYVEPQSTQTHISQEARSTVKSVTTISSSHQTTYEVSSAPALGSLASHLATKVTSPTAPYWRQETPALSSDAGHARSEPLPEEFDKRRPGVGRKSKRRKWPAVYYM